MSKAIHLQEEIASAVDQAKDLVSTFRHSVTKHFSLIEKYGKGLVQPNEIRWWSTYYMLKRLLSFDIGFISRIAEKKLQKSTISILFHLKDLLKPINSASKSFQTKNPNLSTIIPVINRDSCSH